MHVYSPRNADDVTAMADHSSSHGLQRRLGLFSLTSVVVANMIGAGIFTTSGLLIAVLGDPVVMLLLWTVGGVIALSGALAYGALGAAYPRAGGEYAFLSELYHPLLGFLAGWMSFAVGFSAPIAASAMGVSEYLSRAFPAFFLWIGAGRSTDAAEKGVAIGVILLFTMIHMRGIVPGARVQNVLTVMKVGLIVLLLLAGFAFGSGDVGHFGEGQPFSFASGGWKTLGLSLMWIMFAYSGWNAATYIGSEARDPGRILPRSLVAGTALVTLLYIGMNALFVYALRPDAMAGEISVGGLAVGALLGRSAGALSSALIAFALLSSLSAFIILGPRVYYAMAQDGVFFRSLGLVHPRHAVPARSIATQGAIATVMVLSGTFEQILTFMGFALGIFPVLAVLGLFRFRTSQRPARIAAVFYALTGTIILVLSFLERPFESTLALITVAAGVPLYLYFGGTSNNPSGRP